ncbi:hypothetical protein Anapl_16829 [Anas platyrhynchos]|uniref:Uncharacterized protein n=1 Tax=Anas platyrhynchos TaxID=8839 RepID=R0JQJ8_ANAPL|nr:hypothetical protein Anapl_16829 [Anas platyrhynchos]
MALQLWPQQLCLCRPLSSLCPVLPAAGSPAQGQWSTHKMPHHFSYSEATFLTAGKAQPPSAPMLQRLQTGTESQRQSSAKLSSGCPPCTEEKRRATGEKNRHPLAVGRVEQMSSGRQASKHRALMEGLGGTVTGLAQSGPEAQTLRSQERYRLLLVLVHTEIQICLQQLLIEAANNILLRPMVVFIQCRKNANSPDEGLELSTEHAKQ